MRYRDAFACPATVYVSIQLTADTIVGIISGVLAEVVVNKLVTVTGEW